jgi:hypothetical protein
VDGSRPDQSLLPTGIIAGKFDPQSVDGLKAIKLCFPTSTSLPVIGGRPWNTRFNLRGHPATTEEPGHGSFARVEAAVGASQYCIRDGTSFVVFAVNWHTKVSGSRHLSGHLPVCKPCTFGWGAMGQRSSGSRSRRRECTRRPLTA